MIRQKFGEVSRYNKKLPKWAQKIQAFDYADDYKRKLNEATNISKPSIFANKPL